ncbi:DEAD/DEAH box helicase [Hymenobacter sp. M29]|uniref:DEAD/DEAH box helicase n=1 Tax=Hymenobacter mellowenesis TaxID=3063995 RepID=A0ABT9A8X1_9BACT|nr:DEAD/DEAH box helicase [Hymenobacter sp. M29]MDO7846286.1 DEAD/DEAH box helicase [Hymenobacter sp. M29]
MPTPRLLAGFIGINRHLDRDISDLSCARRDATALWALWQDTLPNTDPALLVDEDATQARIEELLSQTLDAATEVDTVLLAFSGHGTHSHRIVTHDTDLLNLVDTTISMASLAERFRNSRARHILLVLDCCFSGGASAKVIEDGVQSRGTGFSLENNFAGRGRVLLAAANVDEEAWEAAGHGLLTAALSEALQAAAGPVEVGGLLAEVTGRVRAEAQRLGLTQTPKWVGDFEGGFVIPALHAGQHYYKAFPEQTGLQVSPAIADLAGFGLPEEVLQVWTQQFPQGLNELQLAAVNDYHVLNGESLLVVAPTSSGKTFIGELAAVKAATNSQRAVFLVPYKALANEKFEQFSALYGDTLGLRVIRCTGDFQDATNAFVRGKYDIALLTYEMFLNLVVRSQGTLSRIGVVVIDEAQFITDPGRGISVELLLTYILSARERGITPQLVALSAVIGNTNGFEHWLRCQALISTKRPVPLEEGVIDRTGLFEYVDPETGMSQTRQMLPPHVVVTRREKPSAQDVIVPLAQALLSSEPTAKLIVFRNMRGKAEGVAGYLAKDLGLPEATELIDALPAQDRSSTSARLRDCLRGGTAFHNTNLAREEREVVERAFRAPHGKVRVLGATTTLAAGINTPASAVILGETEFVGEDQRPFTIAEYKNMVGRAGRLGYNERGQSFIVASTPMERKQLFQRYVLGRPEALHSSFASGNLATWVLRLLAQIPQVRRKEVATLLANTYGGYVAGRNNPDWRTQMDANVENIIFDLIRLGIAEQEGPVLQLTLVGFACANSSLSFDSIARLLTLNKSQGMGALSLERLLALTQVLPEMDDTYTPMLRNGNKEKTWPFHATHRIGNDLVQLYQRFLPDPLSYQRRAKRALVVADWIEGMPMETLEQTYSNSPNAVFSGMSPGDVRRIAEATRYHFRSVVPIMQALHPELLLDDEDLNIISTRLEVGLPVDALPLLKIPTLTRGEILLFAQHGVTDAGTPWVEVEPVAQALFGADRCQILVDHWPH